MLVESREQKSFQDLHRRTEERDWSVGRALVSRLARLQNGNDNCRFPDGRDFGRGKGKVEGRSKELHAEGPKMLEVPGRKSVGARSSGIL